MSAYEIIRSSFRFPRANASLTREQALLWVRDWLQCFTLRKACFPNRHFVSSVRKRNKLPGIYRAVSSKFDQKAFKNILKVLLSIPNFSSIILNCLMFPIRQKNFFTKLLNFWYRTPLRIKVHTTYKYRKDLESSIEYTTSPNSPFLRLFLVFTPQVQRVYVGHKKAAIKIHFRGTHRYLGNTWFT